MGQATFFAPSGGGGAVIIPRTSFASKQGSDLTGLVERLDKPFKTIEAAKAAVALLNPLVNNRCKVVTLSGYWLNENITLQNFIDFELNGDFELDNSGLPYLIGDNNLQADSLITGAPNLKVTESIASSVIKIENSNSNVTGYVNNIYAFTNVNAAISTQRGTLNLKLNNFQNYALAAFDCFNQGQQYIRFNKIDTQSLGNVYRATGFLCRDTDSYQYANGVTINQNTNNFIDANAIRGEQAKQDIFVAFINSVNNNGNTIFSKNCMQTINGAEITGRYNGAAVCSIDTTINNPVNYKLCRIVGNTGNTDGIRIEGDGSILDDVTIVGGGGSRSIRSIGGCNVRLYGNCAATRATAGIIVPMVGVLTISTNTI